MRRLMALEPVATVLVLLSKAPRSLVVPGEVPQDPGISWAIPGYPGGAATFQFLHVEAANWSHHVITMMALLYRVLVKRISYAITAEQWK